LSAELTKTHTFRLFFWAIFPTGKCQYRVYSTWWWRHL